MCLALPGEVLEVREVDGVRIASVDFGGVTRSACLDYVPDADVGSFVVVHLGFAIRVVDEAEARASYAILSSETAEALDRDRPPSERIEPRGGAASETPTP
jgi:hydrogenase expression/formation protein HypC